jgi:tetratricopeptide (TPR) repeat protein
LAIRQRLNPDLLEFDDLKRFGDTVKRPFKLALGAGSLDLAAPVQEPDPESEDPLTRASAKGCVVADEKAQRLVTPLMQEGRVLGLISMWGVKPAQTLEEFEGLLPALSETVLELVRLKVSLTTDQVTGLGNDAALDESLDDALARLTPAGVRGRPSLDAESNQGGVCLLTFKPQGMEHMRERYGLRFGDLVLKQVAGIMSETLKGALCFTQSGGVFYALGNGGAAWARQAGQAMIQAVRAVKLSAPDGGWWQGGVTAGAALWDARIWRGGQQRSEAATVLKARALRALASAGQEGMSEVLFYGEIVERTGRIKQVMPMGQVLVGLGRVHGLGANERFKVIGKEAGPNDAGKSGISVKAEIGIISPGEDESLAVVNAVLDADQPIGIGDRLMRLGPESLAGDQAEQVAEVAGVKVRLILDQATGLPGHSSFLALYKALCTASQPFCAALVRLEGMESMREICGMVGVEALIKALAANLAEHLPEKAILSRYAPDTLGMLLPGGGASEVQPALAAALAQAGSEQEHSLRAGIAGHPMEGFGPEAVLDNAAKALVHAGFLEPGSAVVFDEISLNVSGDALFAQGRIAEAVVEYEKALRINPEDPFVLNSLGVCFGHLSQMDKAVEYFERAKKSDPKDFMAYYNLGYALMARGKMAEAQEQLKKGLEYNPAHGDTLFQLGKLAQGEGRLSEAMEYYRQAAKQDDSPKAVYRSLGEALATAGKKEAAEEAFNQAVKHNPNDAAALAGLAGLYLDRGANREIALSLGRRAHELEPGMSRHIRVMGRALLALDRSQEAAKLIARALEDHKQDPYLLVLLGQAQHQLGEDTAARDSYTRALALEPNLETARSGLNQLTDLNGEQNEQ